MTLKSILLPLIFFSAGLICSRLYDSVSEQGINSDTLYSYSDTLREEDYTYTSPLLLCGISEQVESNSYSDLKTSVEDLIATQMGSEQEVSLYFRQLNSGEWFSIGENVTYSPASLLKLPLYIAYLKWAENDDALLTKELTLPMDDYNSAGHYPPTHPLNPGGTYTIDQLLTAMITESDNNAAYALDQALDPEFKNEIYTDLGMQLPSEDPRYDYMTAKDYSYFFRVLYNGSYLNHEDSEQALKLLTQSTFDEGIRSSVNGETEVAEKFGERGYVDTENNEAVYELHDCGIVYLPGEPYLLCIMTKGKTGFEGLSTTISGIAELIFNELASPRAENFVVVNPVLLPSL